MDLGIAGRTCVVTGASSGIGRATASLLAAEGAHVLLVGRDEGRLAAAADGCRARGSGRVATLALDVTDPGAPGQVDAAVRADLGGPAAILVNSAGTSARKELAALTDADWQAQWELNVMAPMRLMRDLTPAMESAGWGRVVNVSSSAAKRPSTGQLMPYSVTKAAELSLSRSFAELLAGTGVLVNAVAPGATRTEMWTAPGGLGEQAAGGGTAAEGVAAQAAKVPIGRLGEPEEVAAVIALLCSEAGGFVHGAAWSVDGGSVPGIV